MKTIKAFAYVIGVTLGLGACGDDGGGSIPLEEAPDEFEQKSCEQSVACGDYPDVATCKATTGFDDATQLAEIQAAIDRGTVQYDGDKARQCLNGISSSCTWTDLFADETPEACQEFLVGTVAAGGTCFISAECADQGDCQTPETCTMECCMGTCVAADTGGDPIAAGQPCDQFEGPNCVDGYYCKPTTPDGSAGTCTAQVSSGACDAFDACASPQVCNIPLGMDTGTCYSPAAEGATCDPEVFLVACDRLDNYCDMADMTCKKFKAPGETCDAQNDNCVFYAWCNAGTCEAFPGEGQPCGGSGMDVCMGDLECNEAMTCVVPEAGTACTGA